MVLCKYYAQGRCRFGDRCWYEHSETSSPKTYDYSYRPQKSKFDSSHFQHETWNDNYKDFSDPYHWSAPSSPSSGKSVSFSFSKAIEELSSGDNRQLNQQQDQTSKVDLKSVREDHLSWKNGNQWVLSCYGPIKYKGCFPGLEDISQEELRWDAYQALSFGNFESHVNSVKEYIAQVLMKREEINRLTPEVCQILEKIQQGAPVPITSAGDQNYALNSFSDLSSFGGGQSAPQTNATPFSFKLAYNDHSNTNMEQTQVFQMQQEQSLDGLKQDSGSRKFSFAAAFSKYKSEAEPGSSSHTGSVFMQQPTSVFGQSGGSALSPTPQSPRSEQNKTFSTPAPTSGSRALDKNELKTYTPMDLLEDSEREQFMSEMFTLGKIPIRPPPFELCF